MKLEPVVTSLSRHGLIEFEDRSEHEPEPTPSVPILSRPDPLIAKVAELIRDSVVYLLPKSEGKTCKLCEKFKPLAEFHRVRTYRDHRCRTCKSTLRGARYREHAKEEAAYATEWKKANPVRARVHRLKHYAMVRGLDLDGNPTTDRGDLTADEWEDVLESYREPDKVIDGRIKRGRLRCAYCARRTSRLALTIDHVVAISRGGRNTKGNVVPACGACNSAKRDRDLWPVLESPHLDDTSAPSGEVPAEAFTFP